MDNIWYYILWASQLWPNHCRLLAVTSMGSRRIPQLESLVFLQDNIRPHMAKVTLNKLNSLSWESLSHLSYSPDISPFNYYFFLLDNYMWDRKFRSREKLKKKLNNFFIFKDREFFRNGIYKLVSRWEKVRL